MSMYGEQFLPAGCSPHFDGVVATTGGNPQAVWRKDNGIDPEALSSESPKFEVSLPLPVMPFEAALRIGGRFFQEFPHSPDIVLLPRLLCQAHVGAVEVTLSGGPFAFFGFRSQL